MNKNHFTFLFNILKKYILKEILGLIFTFLYTFLVLLTPFISKYLLDTVLIAKNFDNLLQWLSLFFISCLFQPITNYIKNCLFFNISESISLTIKQDILKNVMSAPLSFLEKIHNGSVTSRILNDCQLVSEFVSNIFIVIVKNAFLFFIIFLAMFILSWQISLLIAVLLSFYIFLSFFLSNKLEKISQSKLKKNDMLCQSIDESLSNINLIKTYNLKEFWCNKNLNILEKIYKNNIKINKFKNLFETLSNITIALCLTIIYGIGSVLIFKEYMTIGTIFALSLYFQILITPIYEIINSTIQYRNVSPCLNRVNEYLLLKKEHSYIINNSDLITKDKNSILVKDLSFNCKKDNNTIPILKKVNINFEGNGLYGIIGHSGSGKSTLIKIILGLYQIYSGSIEVDIEGKRIYNLDDVRKKISYVSQNSEFINASIIDNLKLFNEKINNDDIFKVCKSLGLDNKINEFPLNYYSVINEKINLSGGDQQLICFARAILKKSPIYIYLMSQLLHLT